MPGNHRTEEAPGVDQEKLSLVLREVVKEYDRAEAKFQAINSPHEGYAVILEELDELWDEIKPNKGRTRAARKEAIQVATMAIRYVMDLC